MQPSPSRQPEQIMKWESRIAAIISVVVFFCCLFGLPLLGLVLSQFLSEYLIAPCFQLPINMIWFGDLYWGRGPDSRAVGKESFLNVLPMVVWLISWPLVILMVRRMKPWQMTPVTFGYILLVTWVLYIVRLSLGLRLFVPVL
jgi:hypothetical protein